jgi:hypothetical protein
MISGRSPFRLLGSALFAAGNRIVVGLIAQDCVASPNGTATLPGILTPAPTNAEAMAELSRRLQGQSVVVSKAGSKQYENPFCHQ